MEQLREFALWMQTFSPAVMLVAGIALLVVPTWIRWIIALILIFFGLAGLYPGVFDIELPAE